MTASERFLPVWGIIKRAAVKAWSFVMRRRVYILSFLIPAAVLFLSYIIFEVWPFGNRSVLSLDLNAQYVYYYDYMYDVFAGKESLFYSWSRNLSGEFMGIIGYYLASPFNIIVWLFPREWITEGLMVMMLAKAGAAGLSSAYFLNKHRGYSDAVSVMFSVMFALCGFFVVQTMNPMWLDGIVALPLVTAGVERICDKRRFKLYTLSLLYIFVANFYIGYMTGIFSALYFLYYLASGKGSCKHFGQYCGATLMYAAASVSAILMSCFMILPVYKSLSNGKFSFSGTPDYSIVENFDIADIFIRLFPTTYDTVQMEGMPIIYCGTLALIGSVIYFVSRRFSARERIAGGVFVGVMIMFMYIRPLDMMWHGGQMPNWLPYRYSFMVSFLLISFGAQAVDNIARVRGNAFRAAFAVSLAILLFADLNNDNKFYDQVLTVAIPLAVLTAVIIMAYVFKKYRKRAVVSAVMTAVVCAECLLNTSVSLYQMHDDIVFSDRATYRWNIPYTRDIAEKVHELDDGFYRMEKTYHRCVNDPIALRMYGLSHSSSTLNAKAIALLHELGFTSREHYTRYDGATMLTDDILGVKYVFATSASSVPYTETLDITGKNGASVYVNNDALEVTYLAKSDIIGYNVSQMSPFMSQNSVAAMLSGNKTDSIFRSVGEVEFDSENIRSGSTTDAHYSYRKKDEDAEAWISYTVTAQADGPVYMYLPTKYERETMLYINGEYVGNYFLYENYSIEYLGTYKEGEQFEVKLVLLEDVVYFTSAQFYYINMPSLERFQNSMQQLNSDVTLERTGGARLELDVTAPEDCALFTTIPAEEGWTVLVDGVPTEWTTALNDTLLCVPLTQGEHTVVLDFFPAGMKTGLMFTACGVLSFVIMILVLRRMRMADSEREAAETGEDTPEKN